MGEGGGEVIWVMPERNRFFLWEVFPYIYKSSLWLAEESMRAVVQNSRETVALIAAVHTHSVRSSQMFSQIQGTLEKLSKKSFIKAGHQHQFFSGITFANSCLHQTNL